MININGKQWGKLKLSDIQKHLNSTDSDESFFVEYKEENIRNEQIIKEISAFANTYGGYLIIGVKDNKEIVGCDNWSELRISTLIYGLITPIPTFDIKEFALDNNKKIFIIKIEEGQEPPYITSGGKIYQRISSSSQPVTDAYSINRLYNKKADMLKKIESKLYYSPFSSEHINNLCGYVDFGFSILAKDINIIHKKMDNIDYYALSKLIRERTKDYSISKVGYSLCISIGDSFISRGNAKDAAPAELNNFMEILGDGSFRCRVLLILDKDSGIASISSILLINGLFRKIYEYIFGNKFDRNFISSLKYEKLTVLKQFVPRHVLYDESELKKQFDSFYDEQINKYGLNKIISSNRIPLSDFIKMDRKIMEDNNHKFNSKNIYNHLFHTCYANLGCIDNIKIENDSKN